MSEETLDLAVVIVEHNTRDHLIRCLASLFDEGGLDGLRATVWVVDNASEDGGLAIVADRYPGVRRIRSDDNVGYARANNLALRDAGFGGETEGEAGGAVGGEAGGEAEGVAVGAAVGEAEPAAGGAVGGEAGGQGAGQGEAAAAGYRHALLLNPDTIVPRGALAALVAALEAEPDIGAAGPKLLLPDGALDLACRRSFPTVEVSLYRFSGLSRRFPSSRRFGRYNLTYLDPDEDADVDSVVGACMLVRGEAIREVGLLDERFWMYGEDLDWALRLRQRGWRTVYRPSVVVHHVKRAASSGSDRAQYEFQRAMWLFYEKHYSATTPRPVHALVKVAIALRGGRKLWDEMRRDEKRRGATRLGGARRGEAA